jgi:hypothetical protein
MRTLTVRRAAAGTVLPLALVSLAACGSRSSQEVTGEVNAPSSTPSPAAPAHHQVSSAAFVASIKHATSQITTARIRMRMNGSGQTIPISGVIDMTGEHPAMRMTMDLSGMGTPSDLRLVDQTVYIQVPGTKGKFYKVDLTDPNGPLGALGGTLDKMDPNSLMAQLTPAMFKHVTGLGAATVGGRRLHHYRAIVDVRAQSKLASLPKLPHVALPKTATYDVWLDDQGRMARFAMVMGRSMTMSATYTDYGTAPHVTAPPAGDVMELPSSSSIS